MSRLFERKGVVRELYMYPNKQDAKRRITVAGVLIGNQLQIAMSKQRPGEPFNKKVGRGIALSRAISRPVITLPINNRNEEITEHQYAMYVEKTFSDKVNETFGGIKCLHSWIPAQEQGVVELV